MQGKKLFIGNIESSVTENELKELFSEFGTVTDIRVIGDKGIAFMEMSTQMEAEEAKKELHGRDFKGRSLKVSEARKNAKGGRRSFRGRR